MIGLPNCGCLYDPHADRITWPCRAHTLLPGTAELDPIREFYGPPSRESTPDGIRSWLAGDR